VVHVGKRAGCASTPQGFIERLMVREALAGERVVRLKGGDPLLFGRAGEEIAALREAGVRVEVVNGITAGLAAAGALQASWTDRRHAAHGVMLVTGHAQPGARGPDWDAIGRAAASGMTLVLYMGVAQAAHIVARLRAWLPGDVPAAIVQHASGPDERRALTTLDGLVQRLEHDRFGSPAVWIVGQVLDSAPALAAARDAVRAAGPMPAPAPRAPGARIG
jgi:uroporphyrin-III C-methyltransferase